MGPQQTSIPFQASIIYNNTSFNFYYLCHYLPLTTGFDPLSRSLMKFKKGIQPDLDAWIDRTLKAFEKIPLPRDTTIIRALNHDETISRSTPPTSLDLLGQALAASHHCQYIPSLLLKSRPTLKNKALTREQRQTELQNIYSVAPDARLATPNTRPGAHLANPDTFPETAPPNPSPGILLLDDIFTTGTTIRMIIHALFQRFPHIPLQIFTLAKASNRPNPHPDSR